MKKHDLYKSILNTLKRNHYVINNYKRDTDKFTRAEDSGNELLFGTISIRKYPLIMKTFHNNLSVPELAKILTLAKLHKDISKVIHMPTRLARGYKVLDCQEKTGLFSKGFAKKCHVPEKEIDFMEEHGVSDKDINYFNNILHYTHSKFLVK